MMTGNLIELRPPVIDDLDIVANTLNKDELSDGKIVVSIPKWIGMESGDIVGAFVGAIGKQVEVRNVLDIITFSFDVNRYTVGGTYKAYYIVYDEFSINHSQSAYVEFTLISNSSGEQPVNPPGGDGVYASPVLTWTSNVSGGTPVFIGDGTGQPEINEYMQLNGTFTVIQQIDDALLSPDDTVRIYFGFNAFDDKGEPKHSSYTIDMGALSGCEINKRVTASVYSNLFAGFDSDKYDNPGQVWCQTEFTSSAGVKTYSKVWWCYIDTVAPGG